MDPRLAAELELAAVPHDELVRRLYRLALRREPEPGVLDATVERLAAGTLSRASLLRDLVRSVESDRVRLLDDAVAFAAWARAAGERPRELTAPPGSDERPVEIPWCLARLRPGERVLDVGYAFAEPSYLAGLVALGAAELVGVDLAEAEVPGLRSVVADVRALPFEDGVFDVAVCISTLEHVGQDNAVYGIDAAPGGMDGALRELRRVARRLLVTVPAGEPGDHGWFVQREPDGWRGLFHECGFLVFEDEVYELREEGWRAAPGLDPAGVRYGERGPGASAVLCAELHPRTAGAVLRETARRLRQGRSS